MVKSQVSMETSDNEIYQLSMQSKHVKFWRSMAEMMMMDLKSLSLDPTRRDVLKAVSKINKYTDELDNPVSRKIEEKTS